VGAPTFTFIRDRRDDPLDTHKGSYNTFDTAVSSGYFGSEASFSRLLYTNSTYHEFRKSKWVLARNTRIGVENTFGSSTFVPLPERFFAGGSNSLRGFSLNQAGPRDIVTGFPVGGQALLLNQLELRFPAPTLPWFGNNLAPVLFEDAGNVFSRPTEMFPSIFRLHSGTCNTSTNSTTCDFNYFNHSAGFGIRYRTPIGPIRLDFGYSLNPTRFPVLDDPARPVQSTRRLNVYFSVGQSF
jgi:outer membrane protein assembly factor BamA